MASRLSDTAWPADPGWIQSMSYSSPPTGYKRWIKELEEWLFFADSSVLSFSVQSGSIGRRCGSNPNLVHERSHNFGSHRCHCLFTSHASHLISLSSFSFFTLSPLFPILPPPLTLSLIFLYVLIPDHIYIYRAPFIPTPFTCKCPEIH